MQTKKTLLLNLVLFAFLFIGCSAPKNLNRWSDNADRDLWISSMDRIIRPVLSNLSEGHLRERMPIETVDTNLEGKFDVTHLEALGRTITGIAPWLELGPDDSPEGRLRSEYINLSVNAIRQAVDPSGPDHLNFNKRRQPLVDAAFLAHGLLRAPTQLWGNLDKLTQDRLIEELKSSRVIKPSDTNWRFFTAIIEAFLYEMTGECDMAPIDYALEHFIEPWYKGDGVYGDGPVFHMDYYNSFVIQPMMMQVLDVLKKHQLKGQEYYDLEQTRYSRYAAIQERMISPEGTYPVVGRSLSYRFGAFQALSDASFRHILPQELNPAQVRAALSAVIRRQISAPGTFDQDGWLRPGFCGYQPQMGEKYISTGSLYLCSAVFIALGLPPSDPFWSSEEVPWTNKSAWNGVDVGLDHAINN